VNRVARDRGHWGSPFRETIVDSEPRRPTARAGPVSGINRVIGTGDKEVQVIRVARDRGDWGSPFREPPGVSPEEAVAAIEDVLSSIGDTCPECPPEA
jgi:hypothetical protein